MVNKKIQIQLLFLLIGTPIAGYIFTALIQIQLLFLLIRARRSRIIRSNVYSNTTLVSINRVDPYNTLDFFNSNTTLVSINPYIY